MANQNLKKPMGVSVRLTEDELPFVKWFAPDGCDRGIKGVGRTLSLVYFLMARRLLKSAWHGLSRHLHLWEDQIMSQRKPVLEELVSKAAALGMRAIEVGSWLGTSTMILAEVVKANNGTLYCIDTWGGSDSTWPLQWRAQLFDIFSMFREQMRRSGYEHTVFPLVMPSDIGLAALKDESFDFVFIDGDHAYTQVNKDIRTTFRKLKEGGILCGDDCEGRLETYDPTFIETNCELDYVNGVHCGVVKAVGEAFETYDVQHGVWSVRKNAGTQLKPLRKSKSIRQDITTQTR